MRRRTLLILGLVLAMTESLSAAGSVTLTSRARRSFVSYTIAWTSDSSGAVSSHPVTVPQGSLLSIRFIPGSGGTQPTDLYDVTLVETLGVTDLLDGQGANLSNSASTVKQWSPPLFQDGTRTLDLVVANAGNAKTGTVVILVQVQ